MRFSLDKYKFITHDNEVIAISTYAGKTVRGIAKLHPQDTFNLENGKKLAAARCNEKIAAKRFARAVKKIKEAERCPSGFKELVLKTSDGRKSTVGSNPTLSAILH